MTFLLTLRVSQLQEKIKELTQKIALEDENSKKEK